MVGRFRTKRVGNQNSSRSDSFIPMAWPVLGRTNSSARWRTLSFQTLYFKSHVARTALVFLSADSLLISPPHTYTHCLYLSYILCLSFQGRFTQIEHSRLAIGTLTLFS